MLKKHVDDDELVHWSMWRFQQTFRVKPPDMLGIQFWDSSLLPQALVFTLIAFKEHGLTRALPWLGFVGVIDFIQLGRMKRRFESSKISIPMEADKWENIKEPSNFFRYVLSFWVVLSFVYMMLLHKIVPGHK